MKNTNNTKKNLAKIAKNKFKSKLNKILKTKHNGYEQNNDTNNNTNNYLKIQENYHMDILKVCVTNLRRLRYGEGVIGNMSQTKEIIKGSANPESSFGPLKGQSNLLEIISRETINDENIFVENLRKIPFEYMLKNKLNRSEIIILVRSLPPDVINSLIIKEIVDINYELENEKNKVEL